ncbi:MAG: 4-hydroxy-tetrahydrodipicolinate reductase, partial [Lentisphaeria bacterium]|nr:4-hydroxy-tetrahydrodipicolinate reductase [Lentisphaeria bacterium]
MIRTLVIGAGGRMGRMLMARILGDTRFGLGGALECSGSAWIGQDAGLAAGVAAAGIRITAELDSVLPGADAVIDFSTPESTLAVAPKAIAAGASLVIGTTGLSGEQRGAIAALATGGGRVVMAPNMSVGVNMLFALSDRVARVLGDDYDMEVVELHHNRKVDAPSGTAVRLGEILAEATGRDYARDAVHGRVGRVGQRTRREIGMHAIRGGDAVGDHTVIFAAAGERLELVHRAGSRETFVNGALRAVLFLARAKPGLYDMQDVLGLR